MGLIIDVSSYQGAIDWEKAKAARVETVIHRSTIRSGDPDKCLYQNAEKIVKVGGIDLQFYKISYVRTGYEAYNECAQAIDAIEKIPGYNYMRMLWLDLEEWDGRDYTKREAFDVIAAYVCCCMARFWSLGIYANYNYLKHIIPQCFKNVPIWAARYTRALGDVSPFEPVLWQYTSEGRISGIDGYVDLNMKLYRGDRA